MEKIKLIIIIFVSFLFLSFSKQNQKFSHSFSDYSDSINKFTFEIFNKILLKNFNENVFISAFSIHSAMGMVYEGADGETAKEIEKTLFINNKNKNRLGVAKNLIEELNKEEKNKLKIANALWIQNDYKILKSYLSIIEKYYFGKARNLDFKGEPEKSRTIINKWVEEKTEDKIKDLIPEGFLNSSIKLVLTNAIYFKGSWLYKFNKNFTKEEDFKTEEGEIEKVQMMSATGKEFNYAEDENYQILELPYDGETLSMLILLPKNDNLNINYSLFNELKKKLKKQKVNVFIPKYKFEKKYFFFEILYEMGVHKAFEDNADFKKITGKKNLKIGNVIHQAYVQVDEEGTEAAAATGITLRLTSVIIEHIPVFRADHTFLFFIFHNKTNCILFTGKVSKPEF